MSDEEVEFGDSESDDAVDADDETTEEPAEDE